MKNISRRVFIKGLAVAGVAAAASTVLAGCNTNMIPDVDNGTEDDTTEETPAKNGAMTYIVGGDSSKTLTITAGEPVVLGTANTVVVPFTIDNKSGLTFKSANSTAAAKGNLVLAASNVTIDFDGNTTVVSAPASATYGKNMFAATAISVDSDKKETYMMYLEKVPTVWNKLKVTFELQGHDGTNGYTAKKGEFNFTNK